MKCIYFFREVYHLPKTPNSFYCEICGRAYRTKNERDKHVVRHNKDNCLMDRWMHEDPKLYKYECTKHTTCKRYFKKAYSLRKHLKRMGDKDYPTNISRFFRPEIPPDQETIKDYELPPTPPPRLSKGESNLSEPKRRKKKIVRKKIKKDSAMAESIETVEVSVPANAALGTVAATSSRNLIQDSTPCVEVVKQKQYYISGQPNKTNSSGAT